MRKVKQGGKIIGSERIAVMSALNISYELLVNEGNVSNPDSVSSRDVDSLNKKLDEALYRLKQIEI